MSSIALDIQGLGKKYLLRHQARPIYRSLREALAARTRGWMERALHRAANDLGPNSDREEFWALRDVSFQVERGSVVGVIGRNGAGKSTLLKILSRVTDPTEGRAALFGRLASLLEVGTGFHPELTGRENIFLNGAILGMTRAEIRRKFDEIVAFAEVEKFLDTPVKRYSSGMYVRLAFAVAAHLEPEILIVDEVLAVGDASFQKKCLGKMDEVSSTQGRSVLFVSHNMDSVRRLCKSAVWLERGRVAKIGETSEVIAAYLEQHISGGGEKVFDPPKRFENGMPATLRALRIQPASEDAETLSAPRERFSRREAIRVEIEWELLSPLRKPRVGFVLRSAEGAEVMTGFDANSWKEERLEPGRKISSCVLPARFLNEGRYALEIGADALGPPHPFPFDPSRAGPLLRFEIEDDMTVPGKYYGEEGFRDARWPGAVLLDLDWTQEEAKEEN
jgi:lipopolysaccharide transport system ATP-binding protein